MAVVREYCYDLSYFVYHGINGDDWYPILETVHVKEWRHLIWDWLPECARWSHKMKTLGRMAIVLAKLYLQFKGF